MNPGTTSFIFRDGLESDIPACLRLDHSYETDHVWQMTVHHDDSRQYEILFRIERLPRLIDIEQYADEQRLRSVIEEEQCFLVAVDREIRTDVLGYLTMRHDRDYKIGWVRDLHVGRPYRRRTIGSRLLKIARAWAKERGITRLMIEIGTKNVPALRFCEDMGFTFCGFNDKYYLNQDIAVFFSQTLR